MKRLVSSFVLCAAFLSALAQITMYSGKNSFPLVGGNSTATIFYDKYDALVVERSAKMLSQDICEVTGKSLPLNGDGPGRQKASYAVIAGTMGQSKWADALIASGKIDTTGLSGAWERYRVQLVKNPVKGIGQAVVVVGSDRRGTAFGLLSISRAAGVSPWIWWMDAKPQKRSTVGLQVKSFTSKQPSVKYRGVFINDEDWGLLPWARKTYEPEVGNFGPKTYARVCELLLRLNANYLAPAMHEASLAFFKQPANQLVADTFAIAMGSSHCEPLLLNTASEWDKKKYGPWDYVSNRRGIDSVLNARAELLAPYENVYTLALRGLHDVAMAGSDNMSERKNTMQEALMAQRDMIACATGKAAETIPQAFTPYKEVLDVYDHGLQLPEDVTIIWPDDNYGYMKRLSSPDEQKRSGRSGVYYHASYLGRPHDHLWMATQSPCLMYEELRKAYDLTADRVWLLNAGDIKGCEFAVDQFLAMAYDIERFSYDRCLHYRTEWTESMLHDAHGVAYDKMFRIFYDLAFQRKPECMGWGQEWANDDHAREQTTDTEFSLTNYREAERRISDYMTIGHMADSLMALIPEALRSCFYEAVYYPVKGAELMNRMTLAGQRNRWYAMQNRAATERWAKEALACWDSLQTITKGYNSLEKGKWNGIMSMTQGVTASYFEKPKLRKAGLSEQACLGVMAEGEYGTVGPRRRQTLPVFNRYLPEREYYIDVYNKGIKPLQWKVTASEPWIRLSASQGTTAEQQRIMVSLDWEHVPQTDLSTGLITIEGAGSSETIEVSAFNPTSPSDEEMKGLFVEDNGIISIPAECFVRKTENDDTKMTVIENLGCEGKAVQMGNPVMPRQNSRAHHAPCLDYEFYTWQQGMVDVYTYVLPTFTTSVDRGFAGHERTNVENQYGVRIDDGLQVHPATNSWEYAQQWYESVPRNTRINKTTLYIKEPGKHYVHIICQDPGTILQKIVIDFGGQRRSYLGPQSTQVK